MNNKCKNLKQKMNKSLYCKKKKKIIKISECSNCKNKEYENAIYSNERKITLKNETYKQSKKEKTRFSIIYKDLTKCAICSSKIGIEKNEIFEGAKRNISIKYGFVIPLCRKHHNEFHDNREFALKIKRQFQEEFEKTYTREEFLSIIHRNYL